MKWPPNWRAVLKRLQPGKRRRRKPPLPESGPATSPAPDHSAVRAADPYAFEVVHRRLAWMLRLLAMVVVGLIALLIVLGAAISELVPLKEVQLGLVRIEARDDRLVPVDPATLVRVLPITKDTPGFDLICEAFVRRYVRILLEIDRVSQDDRMREANGYSDPDWWRRFIRERKKEIDAARESGLLRSVIVESVDMVSDRNGVRRYAADIVQTDERDGKVTETKRLRAYVALTPRPHTVRPSEKFENPSGLRVLDVALKGRGNS